jgi:hypothetical protein
MKSQLESGNLSAWEPLKGRNLGELISLLAALPKLGAEAEAFESDIKVARESQPVLPKGS